MRLTKNDMNLEYVRKKYKVPAYKGVEIKYQGYPDEIGIIVGSDGNYVTALFNEKPKERFFHPGDIEYLGVKLE